MATKTVNSNYAEATYSRSDADDLRINVPHLKSSLSNSDIASYMNDFIICLGDMLLDPPVTMKTLAHVVSAKTYYGV